jgi:hypothetical protein
VAEENLNPRRNGSAVMQLIALGSASIISRNNVQPSSKKIIILLYDS